MCSSAVRVIDALVDSRSALLQATCSPSRHPPPSGSHQSPPSRRRENAARVHALPSGAASVTATQGRSEREKPSSPSHLGRAGSRLPPLVVHLQAPSGNTCLQISALLWRDPLVRIQTRS